MQIVDCDDDGNFGASICACRSTVMPIQHHTCTCMATGMRNMTIPLFHNLTPEWPLHQLEARYGVGVTKWVDFCNNTGKYRIC